MKTIAIIFLIVIAVTTFFISDCLIYQCRVINILFPGMTSPARVPLKVSIATDKQSYSPNDVVNIEVKVVNEKTLQSVEGTDITLLFYPTKSGSRVYSPETLFGKTGSEGIARFSYEIKQIVFSGQTVDGFELKAGTSYIFSSRSVGIGEGRTTINVVK